MPRRDRRFSARSFDTDARRRLEAFLLHHGYAEGGLQAFQRWHGFPATGRLNHWTVRSLNAVRCCHPERARSRDAEHTAFLSAATSAPRLVTDEDVGTPRYTRREVPGDHPYEVIGARWSSRSLRFGFAGLPPHRVGDTALEAVRRAFGTWSREANLRLEEAPPERAEIRVMWTPGRAADPLSPDPFYGPGNKVAVGYYPYPFSDELAGDLHFDTAEPWAVDPAEGLDIETVALHEIGHCLGVGHSRNPDSAMHPEYAAERRQLHPDDVQEFESHYDGVA